jgi:hypothetical protein
VLDGIIPEKERLKEVEQLLKEDKFVIHIKPGQLQVVAGEKKGIGKTIRRIAAEIAVILGALAALFALLDSAKFIEFINSLFP